MIYGKSDYRIRTMARVTTGDKLELRRGGTWIQRWRVPLGFLCAALFILFARPRPMTLAVGAGVSLLGLLLRAWASGHLRKNDALATSGPYAYTRNPLYLGSFIMGLGFTLASGRWCARSSLHRALPWHLFAGNARRIRDLGHAFWQEL